MIFMNVLLIFTVCNDANKLSKVKCKLSLQKLITILYMLCTINLMHLSSHRGWLTDINGPYVAQSSFLCNGFGLFVSSAWQYFYIISSWVCPCFCSYLPLLYLHSLLHLPVFSGYIWTFIVLEFKLLVSFLSIWFQEFVEFMLKFRF